MLLFYPKSIDGEIETTRLFFADGPIENWLTENPEVYGAIFISKDKKIKAVGIPKVRFMLLIKVLNLNKLKFKCR